jgi:putative flippase GtrA
MPYQAAYLVAYVIGIVFSYVFNARFVFRDPLSWRAAMTYPSV